ncbi:MAG: transposase [Opitutales bacterium]|nr:transposase [Opitutales bacterium]
MDQEVCVHVMSRVVQKRFLIDEEGMVEMRRILRTQARFAGMEVITFCFLKNHFHILLHLDPATARKEVSDEELVRRFRALYGGKRSPSLGVDAESLAVVLRGDSGRAESVRGQLKARMGDVSVFMREFKTRFTFWYNEHYQTVGTFWAERFRSVLVEPGSLALRAVAAYVDLNAVRAGLADTPLNYRFCGLGEAAGGQSRARAAYEWLVRQRDRRGQEDRNPRDCYERYLAFVNRLIARLAREHEALKERPGSPVERQGGQEAAAPHAYSVKGGAVGSAGWVDRLRATGGIFGFLQRKTTRSVVIDGADTDIHAARGWRSS